jgi:hypothetical protein
MLLLCVLGRFGGESSSGSKRKIGSVTFEFFVVKPYRPL